MTVASEAISKCCSRAKAWSNSQLLSKGPPATAIFLPRIPAEILDRRRGFDHDRAESCRIGEEDKPSAEISLPRNPRPVAENDIGGAPQEGDFRGFGRRKLHNLDLKSGFLVKSPRLDDSEFPGKCSGFLHCETKPVRRWSGSAR